MYNFYVDKAKQSIHLPTIAFVYCLLAIFFSFLVHCKTLAQLDELLLFLLSLLFFYCNLSRCVRSLNL